MSRFRTVGDFWSLLEYPSENGPSREVTPRRGVYFAYFRRPMRWEAEKGGCESYTACLPPLDAIEREFRPFRRTSNDGRCLLFDQDDLSFKVGFWDDVETLITSGRRKKNFDGALYVPELAPDDPCIAQTEDLIPSNVTRQENLPDSSCSYIAVAPWVSADCMLQYLSVARSDHAVAAVVYIPSNNETSSLPPVDDSAWELNDDGTWGSEGPFPVYAIPGGDGEDLTRKLALYSGSLSDAPYGDQLVRNDDPNAQIRVFATVNLENNENVLPRLWIFLLVLLVILFSGVTVSAVMTRIIQRRRRQSLSRRIAAGEVDLEMLRIKRLNVPQHVLDKMPVYKYDEAGQQSTTAPMPDTSLSSSAGEGSGIPCQATPDGPSKTDGDTRSPTSRAEPLQIGSTSDQHHGLSYSQLTCAICLDDYVAGESTVRELPCHHIFHPECVDLFLLQNSSLCPVCKTSALPAGYCPEEITNNMVRQERLARRLQERRDRLRGEGEAPQEGLAALQPPLRRLSRQLRQLRQGSTSSNGLPSNLHDSTTGNTAADNAERQEEMRRRAVAMLGDERMAEDEEREREASTPRWRRVLQRVLPT